MIINLNPSVFDFDVPAAAERISTFIAEKRLELHREGVLVSLSGGLDSSTVLALSVHGVGKERVKALLLPERQGNPEAVPYAQKVAAWAGVETITRDISSILETLGTYNFVLPRLPTRAARAFAFRAYFRARRKNPFQEIIQGEGDEMMHRGFALFNVRQRVRMVVEYLVAEQQNLLVVGAAHKSEDLVGLYVKFGVDDLADLMPLKDFYRTQTLRLAEYLGVPEEIRQRTPNPDLIPGVNDKYNDILGIAPETVDLLLYGIENGMEDEEIARQLGLNVVKVGEIRRLVRETEHMRRPSQAPE